MHVVNELFGTSGRFSLSGYKIPGAKDRVAELLHVLHTDIPGSHDLLIALMLTQKCPGLGERSSTAIAAVFGEYQSTAGQVEPARLKTFIVAAITELKMILDELKEQPPNEMEEVLSLLANHFVAGVGQLDTSFEGLENLYLLSNANTGRYWLSLRRHVQ